MLNTYLGNINSILPIILPNNFQRKISKKFDEFIVWIIGNIMPH